MNKPLENEVDLVEMSIHLNRLKSYNTESLPEDIRNALVKEIEFLEKQVNAKN